MKPKTRDRHQLLAADPGLSAWVSANAGSGKTHVLVARIARLLIAGAEPSSILCLTYTNAAAAEMAQRIYRTLGSWATMADAPLRQALGELGIEAASRAVLVRARKLFALALDTPGGFKIQTIHGFCEHVLQLFPVEAGMAPGFRILEEKQSRLLLQQAREQSMAEADSDRLSPEAEALAEITRFKPAETLDTILDQYLKGAPEFGSPGNTLNPDAAARELRSFLGLSPTVTLDDLAAEILNFDEEAMGRAAHSLAAAPMNPDAKKGKNQTLGLELLSMLEQGSPALRIASLRATFILTKAGELRRGKLTAKSDQPDHSHVAQFIDAEQQRLLPLFAAHDDLTRVLATRSLLVLAQAVLTRFVAAKRALAAYDFDDLIAVTRDLLTDKAAAAWILYKLDRGIAHVLIDEAQDTSPAQWQIIQALTEEFFAGEGATRQAIRTLFVVGDQKQSIYSFQGADVRIFESARMTFRHKAEAAGQNMPDVPLTISYRSTAAILHAVDSVFAEGAPARTALGLAGTGGLIHQGQRVDGVGLFEVWPLADAGESKAMDPWQAPSQLHAQASSARLLASIIARTIKSWIGNRMISGSDRPVKAGDILLLFRRRSTLFDLLIGELRSQGVPVAGTDRLRPAQNLAVQDMLTLMRTLALPQDDYALACLLKSPLMRQPLTEGEMFILAQGRKSSLRQCLSESDDAAARSCAADLLRYQGWAKDLRPFEFIAAVLRHCQGAIVARLGREAEDALAALMDAALDYEREQTASILGFAEWFHSEELEIKRDMEGGRDEVRLMTVHAAKGLEAPIVILPDAADTKSRNTGKQLLFLGDTEGLPLWNISGLTPSPRLEEQESELKDLDHAESCRLLYVAMTRARDELFICGAGKGEASSSSWYGLVRTALETLEDFLPGPVLIGGTGLRYGVEPQQARRPVPSPQTLVDEFETPVDLMTPLAPDLGRRKQVTPSGLANPAQLLHSAETARRGRIIHQALQHMPDLTVEQRPAFVEGLFRRHGLDPSIALDLLSLFGKPDMQALFGPNSEGEVPVAARLKAGGRLTGVIDRLVLTEREILILDYKSDAQPKRLETSHPHVRQLAAYAHIMAQIHQDKSIRAGILWTGPCRLDWLSHDQLAKARADLAEELGQPQT